MNADGCIALISRSPINRRVVRVNGRWSVRMSDCVYSFPLSTHVRPYSFPKAESGSMSFARTAAFGNPPLKIRMTRLPTRPIPTMPTVSPFSLRPISRLHRFECIIRSAREMFLNRSSIRPMVISATAADGASGVYVTAISRLRAASKSTLSKPIPTLAINFNCGAVSMALAVIGSVPAIRMEES